VNVRHAVAGQAPVPEDVVAQVTDDHATSGLDARTKAALRWTDAYLGDPAAGGAALRADVLRVLSEEELAELTFALMRFQGGSKLRLLFRLLPEIAPGTVA
jgi:alkylhydroperoxidase family enzyme